MRHYDIAIIGTGPAGQKAAIQAAKLGKRVAIVEKNPVLGGAQVNTGTLPSKALREAVLHLTGASKRGLFGESHRVKRNITIADLIIVGQQVMRKEWEIIRDAFDRNGVELLWGRAHFEGPNLLQITRHDENELITADKFIIATGTRPARPDAVPFNDRNIFCSDSLLRMEQIPKTMIVVGGGVIGVEYAAIFATLGVRVILIEGRNQVLGFLDTEVAEAFQYHLRQKGVTLRLGEKVQAIEEVHAHNGEHLAGDAERAADAEQRGRLQGALPEAAGAPVATVSRNGAGVLVQATLESGKKIRAQTLLYAVGRQGVCGELGLDNVGLTYDDRERLKVNEHYQTQVPHIYAAGDVIGFPALASTAMEQGRLAVCHAFGQPCKSMPELFPYGIYAVPEISMVGKTEQQLTQEGIPYEAGVASYTEIARGQLLGDTTGMLKLLIHQDDHRILGVHIIGSGATELIHIGQAVMTLGGTAEYFIQNVFNFPTLAEAYKVAAYNGLNKLQHV